MKSTFGKLLACILAVHQLIYAVPSAATLNVQAGKPLDSSSHRAWSTPRPSASVEADLFSGSATLKIPILVPRGTGGLTPEVALAYNSDLTRTSTPLGVGWSLDVGPSVIARSTRDGAPTYDDSLDTFELGGQRLKRTGVAGRFVTENFDFSRIERITGDYWRVLRPDGTRLYFGYQHAPTGSPPNDSLVTSIQVNALEPTSSVCPDPWAPCLSREKIIDAFLPFAWHLDRVEDRNGNVVELIWGDLGDQGVRYLVEIRYSGHVAGAINQVPAFGGADDGSLSRSRVIRFTYTAGRLDTLPSYRTGFPRQLTHRLTSIHVEVDGSLVRHYVLDYEQSPASGRSRLIRVRERGADDDPSTELVTSFDYGNGGAAGWTSLDTRWALPAGLTFVQNGRDRGIRLEDVNGDGYPDVVQGRSGTRRTYLGGPNGFSGTPSPQWAPPVDFATSDGYTGAAFADLDGDGRPDIVLRRLNVTGTNRTTGSCGTSRQHEVGALTRNAWVNTGSGWQQSANDDFGTVGFSTTPYAYAGSAQSCPVENTNTASRLSGLDVVFDQASRVVDVNGNGRADIIYKRAASGSHVEGNDLYITTELRAGVVLNDRYGGGLASGGFDNAHDGDVYNLPPSGPPTVDVFFRKHYDRPTWQAPLNAQGGVFWSNFNTCKASENVLADAHTGKERLVDLNGDGLPEILESAIWYECPFQGCNGWLLQAASVNNGYGWKYPGAYPEFGIWPPYYFYGAVSSYAETWFNYPSPGKTTCAAVAPGDGVDYGVRFVDLNGDGVADALGGGLGNEVLLWDATVPIVGHGTSVFTRAPEWDTPVNFRADNGRDSGVRLALMRNNSVG
jgi:hypothetical protein